MKFCKDTSLGFNENFITYTPRKGEKQRVLDENDLRMVLKKSNISCLALKRYRHEILFCDFEDDF